jgi:diguanylate cyclase (GGDEF)-like protein/PAS domain S-box-containing protein
VGPWQFPPYTLVLVLAALLACGVAALAWPRRSAPGGTAFVLMMVATATWELFRVFEAIAIDPGDKIDFARFEYLGIATVPVLWLLFTRQYSRRDYARPGLGPAWLWIVPAATLVLAFSNEQHHWFWSEITPASAEPGADLVYAHGPAFWVTAFYNYLLLLIGTVTLFGAIIRGKGVDRRQTIALLAGALVTWVANMAYLSGLSPFTGLDPTPFTFTLTGTIYAYTLYRYRLFDLVPVSRHTLLDNMIEGVLVLDNDRRIADLNTAATRFLGISGDSCLGADANQLLARWPQLLQYCDSEREERGEIQMLGRHLDVRAVPLQESERRRHGLLLVLRDITGHRKAEDQLREANARLQAHVVEIEALQIRLREQTIRDSLTGLFNRRYLEETLQRELARAARAHRPLGIVMIDVDHFKEINDAHGHSAGDAALQSLGALLAANTRGGDVACRYGGEEFVLALPGATLAVACERAEHLRRAVETLHVQHGDAILSMTISAGIAAYPEHGNRADQVLDNADQALYQAKNSGRNHCVVRAVGLRTAPGAKIRPLV